MSKYVAALVGCGVGALSTSLMMSGEVCPIISMLLILSRVIDPKVKKMVSTNLGADQDAKKPYCLNVNLYVKPDRREEFLACIKANQSGTLTSEPLALRYDWGESATEPNTFHFHEMYEGWPLL